MLEMTYMGYYQIVCENGHQSLQEVFHFGWMEKWKCPYCNAKMAWNNLIESAEGGEQNYIELDVLRLEVMCTCHCGDKHVKVPAVYKIPQKTLTMDPEPVEDYENEDTWGI